MLVQAFLCMCSTCSYEIKIKNTFLEYDLSDEPIRRTQSDPCIYTTFSQSKAATVQNGEVDFLEEVSTHISEDSLTGNEILVATEIIPPQKTDEEVLEEAIAIANGESPSVSPKALQESAVWINRLQQKYGMVERKAETKIKIIKTGIEKWRKLSETKRNTLEESIRLATLELDQSINEISNVANPEIAKKIESQISGISRNKKMNALCVKAKMVAESKKKVEKLYDEGNELLSFFVCHSGFDEKKREADLDYLKNLYQEQIKGLNYLECRKRTLEKACQEWKKADEKKRECFRKILWKDAKIMRSENIMTKDIQSYLEEKEREGKADGEMILAMTEIEINDNHCEALLSEVLKLEKNLSKILLG